MTDVNDLLRRIVEADDSGDYNGNLFKEAHEYLDSLKANAVHEYIEERAKYDVSKEYNEPPRLIVELCQDHPYQGFELVTRKIIQPNPAEFSLLCRGCGKDDRPLRVTTPEDMVQRQIGRSIDGAVPRQLVHDRIDSEAVRLTRLEGVVRGLAETMLFETPELRRECVIDLLERLRDLKEAE